MASIPLRRMTLSNTSAGPVGRCAPLRVATHNQPLGSGSEQKQPGSNAPSHAEPEFPRPRGAAAVDAGSLPPKWRLDFFMGSLTQEAVRAHILCCFQQLPSQPKVLSCFRCHGSPLLKSDFHCLRDPLVVGPSEFSVDRRQCCRVYPSRALIVILDTDNVVLAEVAAGLDLDQFQQNLAGVFQPVHCADRDID
jgi:hypothetical protein